MPDLMCRGAGCKLKESCYRYRAKPKALNQSYFMKSPNQDLRCDQIWKLTAEHELRPVEEIDNSWATDVRRDDT